MILAAIDIGSNAVRLQITRVINFEDKTTFKKVQYIRFPLRLGSDVFADKMIGDKKSHEFVQLMRAFKIMIDLYQVDEYYACATSAMREASNGQHLADLVAADCGLKINIITGDVEAEMINRVIAFQMEEGTYLHIDVGGGSTELNVYEGKKKLNSKSFPLGTVRILKKSDQKGTWDKMFAWIASNIDTRDQVVAIGTGGNIRKIFELAKGEKGKYISFSKLKETQSLLKEMNYEERMQNLQLNPDRADVIIPASEIYLKIMAHAGANKILVPDVGLKDGIISYLYNKDSTLA